MSDSGELVTVFVPGAEFERRPGLTVMRYKGREFRYPSDDPMRMMGDAWFVDYLQERSRLFAHD